jgi:hypothetical protein
MKNNTPQYKLRCVAHFSLFVFHFSLKKEKDLPIFGSSPFFVSLLIVFKGSGC